MATEDYWSFNLRKFVHEPPSLHAEPRENPYKDPYAQSRSEESIDNLYRVLISLRGTLEQRHRKIPDGAIDDNLSHQILSFLHESAKVLELQNSVPTENEELFPLHTTVNDTIKQARRIGKELADRYPQYSHAFF